MRNLWRISLSLVLSCGPSAQPFVKSDVVLANGLSKSDSSRRVVSHEKDARDVGARRVTRREVGATDSRPKLWIYEPAHEPTEKLPLVLIAPAGSSCLTGMSLGPGDVPEHRPWAEAGFLVVAYELRGASLDVEGMKEFRRTMAGTLDGMASLQWALENYPVDERQIIAVGHSSAATHALTFGGVDVKVTKIVAFAPALDIIELHGPELAKAVERAPEQLRFLRWASPALNSERIRKPVFLFVAKDDETTSPDDVFAFADALRAHHVPVTLKVTDAGGHYEPMVSHGIPAAIEWAREPTLSVPEQLR